MSKILQISIKCKFGLHNTGDYNIIRLKKDNKMLDNKLPRTKFKLAACNTLYTDINVISSKKWTMYTIIQITLVIPVTTVVLTTFLVFRRWSFDHGHIQTHTYKHTHTHRIIIIKPNRSPAFEIIFSMAVITYGHRSDYGWMSAMEDGRWAVGSGR